MNAHNDPKLIPEFICSDFKKSLDFYLNILGFKIEYDHPEDNFAMIEHQGSMIMLDQKTANSWVGASLEKPYGRGVNLQMEVSGIDALYKRVTDSSASIFLKIENKEYRCDDEVCTSRQFIVEDPDGYLLRFFEEI